MERMSKYTVNEHVLFSQCTATIMHYAAMMNTRIQACEGLPAFMARPTSLRIRPYNNSVYMNIYDVSPQIYRNYDGFSGRRLKVG